ncbi:unnamed protein product [Alternaria alternata]
MPIHTLDDTNRPKAGNSNIGRWFTEWTPKFKPAPPETKPTQTDKATTRKPAKNKRKISAKRPAKIAKSEDYDHDDGDDYYQHHVGGYQKMDNVVQEEHGKGGKIVKCRGMIHDYPIMDDRIEVKEELQKGIEFYKQELEALLREKTLRRRQIAELQCDHENPDDEAKAKSRLQNALRVTGNEFNAYLGTDNLCDVAGKMYQPAFVDTVYKREFDSETREFYCKIESSKSLQDYYAGYLALRRCAYEMDPATESVWPNKEKRVELTIGLSMP